MIHFAHSAGVAGVGHFTAVKRDQDTPGPTAVKNKIRKLRCFLKGRMWQGKDVSKQTLGGAARHYIVATDTQGSVADALRGTGDTERISEKVYEYFAKSMATEYVSHCQKNPKDIACWSRTRRFERHRAQTRSRTICACVLREEANRRDRTCNSRKCTDNNHMVAPHQCRGWTGNSTTNMVCRRAHHSHWQCCWKCLSIVRWPYCFGTWHHMGSGADDFGLSRKETPDYGRVARHNGVDSSRSTSRSKHTSRAGVGATYTWHCGAQYGGCRALEDIGAGASMGCAGCACGHGETRMKFTPEEKYDRNNGFLLEWPGSVFTSAELAYRPN